MIITSWNVNSVRARVDNIQDYLKKFSPNIVMIQEIKTQEETFPKDVFNNNGEQGILLGFQEEPPTSRGQQEPPTSRGQRGGRKKKKTRKGKGKKSKKNKTKKGKKGKKKGKKKTKKKRR